MAYCLSIKIKLLNKFLSTVMNQAPFTSPASSLLPVHKFPSFYKWSPCLTVQPLNFSLNDPCCLVFIYSPLTEYSCSVWCTGNGGSDTVGLLRPGHKRHPSFSLASPGLFNYRATSPCVERTFKHPEVKATWTAPGLWPTASLPRERATSEQDLPGPGPPCHPQISDDENSKCLFLI